MVASDTFDAILEYTVFLHGKVYGRPQSSMYQCTQCCSYGTRPQQHSVLQHTPNAENLQPHHASFIADLQTLQAHMPALFGEHQSLWGHKESALPGCTCDSSACHCFVVASCRLRYLRLPQSPWAHQLMLLWELFLQWRLWLRMTLSLLPGPQVRRN